MVFSAAVCNGILDDLNEFRKWKKEDDDRSARGRKMQHVSGMEVSILCYFCRIPTYETMYDFLTVLHITCFKEAMDLIRDKQERGMMSDPVVIYVDRLFGNAKVAEDYFPHICFVLTVWFLVLWS